MKKFLVIIISLALFMPITLGASFSDVPETHENYAAIESLKNLGIVNGNPDGTFRPEDSVNRAAALKMILLSAKIEINEEEELKETGFPDVNTSDWFARYTKKAKEIGIVKGQGDTGKFTPTQQVKKAEFLKMLLESFEIDLTKHQNLTEGVSADTSAGQWFLPYMSYAKIVGIISPTLDNRLEPEKALTRGECAEIIYKLLIINRGGDAQKMLNITESHLINILVALNENDIEEALKEANEAVYFSERAVEAAPDQGLTKAANKISLGFQELCYAYQAGLTGDTEALAQHVETAKTLAGEAYADDPSTQPLGKKIKEQGDILLEQAQLITTEE